MKQETPITLHVKSVIEDDGNQEVIEFRTTGFYYVKQNKVYLSYYEEHDLGKVKTIVKVSEGEVGHEVRRCQNESAFRNGSCHNC